MMPSKPIRVLCVDDHPMVLEGLVAVINGQSDMLLVGTASSGVEAVRLFREHRPDVTVMDLGLPVMSGREAICAIRHEWPNARIIVLTMFDGDEDIRRALGAGAVTYVLKDVRSGELLEIVRKVHAGMRPLPANIASLLETNADEGLTTREIEVLGLIAKGMRNREIGSILGISNETTKVHVKNILAKLNVVDRTAAVNVGLQRGIIHLK
jgi:DNA-binding NarL/FixJ family response regulator